MTTSTTNSTGSVGGLSYTYSADASANTSSATPTNATEAQDRFLKLLVAQMNNQDPMNPMDNAQMTSQIAQINTVSGIQQLNDTMKSMTSQISAMQVLQAGNLVGHTVLSSGNQLTVDTSSHTAVGALQLDAAATDVKVTVLNASGATVDTLDLGALPAGQHGFQLDSTNYPASGKYTFTIAATNGSTPVAATPLQRDVVNAVSSGSDGALNLNLVNGGNTPYSSVRAVL